MVWMSAGETDSRRAIRSSSLDTFLAIVEVSRRKCFAVRSIDMPATSHPTHAVRTRARDLTQL